MMSEEMTSGGGLGEDEGMETVSIAPGENPDASSVAAEAPAAAGAAAGAASMADDAVIDPLAGGMEQGRVENSPEEKMTGSAGSTCEIPFFDTQEEFLEIISRKQPETERERKQRNRSRSLNVGNGGGANDNDDAGDDDEDEDDDTLDPLEWAFRKVVPIPEVYYWDAIAAYEKRRGEQGRQEQDDAREDDTEEGRVEKKGQTPATATSNNNNTSDAVADRPPFAVPRGIKIWHDSFRAAERASAMTDRWVAQPVANFLGLNSHRFSDITDHMSDEQWEKSRRLASMRRERSIALRKQRRQQEKQAGQQQQQQQQQQRSDAQLKPEQDLREQQQEHDLRQPNKTQELRQQEDVP